MHQSPTSAPIGHSPTPRALNAPQAARPEASLLHIPSLDGLRALSFFLVFVGHAGADKIPAGFGVTVFFFLSGYLITTLLRQEVERTGTVNFRLFYLRRAWRILPPFYLVLTSASLLTALGVLSGQLSMPAVLAQALHYANYWIAFHGWTGVAAGTGVYWSLAIEEHFYLVFPALFLGLRRLVGSGRGMALTMLGLCALVMTWRCVLVFVLHAPSVRTYVCTDARADSMLFGCALAVWHNPALDNVGRPLSRVWRYVCLPAAVVTLLATFLVRSDQFRDSIRYSLQGVALVPIFVTAIRQPEWTPYRLLNTPVLRHVGLLSYSLYLVHYSVLDYLERQMPGGFALRVVVGLMLSLLLAQGIYRWIEKPCARIRRRLS